ncbi:type II secretion system F family protein [Planctomycetota bacterium]
MISKISLVYYDLAILLDAGMPLIRSLETVEAGVRGKLGKAFSGLVAGVSQAKTLPETMAQYPAVFKPLDVAIVQAADTSGNLPASFKMLSNWYQLTNRLANKIFSGMLLPIVVINIAAFVSPLPAFILGRIGTTGYLIDVIRTLAILYVPLSVILGIIFLTPKTGPLRLLLDRLVLWVPLLRKAIRELAIGRYCRGFGMLYKAGVPITICTEKAADLTGNAVIGSFFKGGAVAAKAGSPASEGFSNQLDSKFLQLWRVGEESGELDKVIEKLGDAATDRAEFLFQQLATWLPRLAYFLVCIIIIMKIFGAAAYR